MNFNFKNTLSLLFVLNWISVLSKFDSWLQIVAGIENNKSSFCFSMSHLSGVYGWENHGGTMTNGSIGFGPASIANSEYNMEKRLNSKPKYTLYGTGWDFSYGNWTKNTNVRVGKVTLLHTVL